MTRRIRSPAAFRIARISNTLNVRASARIETAIAENDSRTPAIQKTTRARLPLFMARGRSDLVALSGPLDDAETELWMLTHPESRHLRRIATVATHIADALILA